MGNGNNRSTDTSGKANELSNEPFNSKAEATNSTKQTLEKLLQAYIYAQKSTFLKGLY